jgi:membrane protease subunit HflK
MKLLVLKIFSFVGLSYDPWSDFDKKDIKKPIGEKKKSTPDDFFESIDLVVKKFFGGGSGNSGSKNPINIPAIAALLISAYLISSSVYKIDADEGGIVIRMGRYNRTEYAGLHWKMPYPIEQIYKYPFTRLNKIELGYKDTSQAKSKLTDSLMLTSDENMIDVNLQVQWRVSDLRKFFFTVNDPILTVESVARSSIREIVGKNKLTNVITDGRVGIEDEVKSLMQETVDSYDMGIDVISVKTLRVDPPAQVIDAFRDVQTARVDKERKINEAIAMQNKLIPEARGMSEKIINEAMAYKISKINSAKAEANKFKLLNEQYAKSKDVTKKRIYIETMQDVMSGKNKIIVDDNVRINMIYSRDKDITPAIVNSVVDQDKK